MRGPVPFIRTFCLAVLPVFALVGCDGPLPTDTAATTLPVEVGALGVASASSTSDILAFADLTDLGDDALRRRGAGVTLSGHMEADPGETFTVWAVVFNVPESCSTSPCGLADLSNPAVMADVLRIAGGIAGGEGLHVSGRLKEGDTSESLFPDPIGLLDAMAAEIHFIYRTHGDMLPGEIDDQIMSVLGGCDTNTCEDLAFSVHLP